MIHGETVSYRDGLFHVRVVQHTQLLHLICWKPNNCDGDNQGIFFRAD